MILNKIIKRTGCLLLAFLLLLPAAVPARGEQTADIRVQLRRLALND